MTWSLEEVYFVQQTIWKYRYGEGGKNGQS